MKNPYGEDPSVAGLFKYLSERDKPKTEEDEYKGWPAAGPPKDR